MKATLNLAESTILMDCTPQELAGLLSLLQPCPKQGLPSSDHHPDEPPAPTVPVQDPEPAAQEPAPAEPVQNPVQEPQEPAPAEPVQDPEPAAQVPEPVPNEPVQTPQEPEPDPAIAPEPAEREPLGKALKRLKKEKAAGRLPKYQPVYARNAEGDVIYCDSVAEMAIKLGVTAQCVNQSIKHNYNCKGYKIKKDDPKTVL